MSSGIAAGMVIKIVALLPVLKAQFEKCVWAAEGLMKAREPRAMINAATGNAALVIEFPGPLW